MKVVGWRTVILGRVFVPFMVLGEKPAFLGPALSASVQKVVLIPYEEKLGSFKILETPFFMYCFSDFQVKPPLTFKYL